MYNPNALLLGLTKSLVLFSGLSVLSFVQVFSFKGQPNKLDLTISRLLINKVSNFWVALNFFRLPSNQRLCHGLRYCMYHRQQRLQAEINSRIPFRLCRIRVDFPFLPLHRVLQYFLHYRSSLSCLLAIVACHPFISLHVLPCVNDWVVLISSILVQWICHS